MCRTTFQATTRVVALLAAAVGACSLASCAGAGSDTATIPHAFFGIVPGTPLGSSDFARMGRANVGSFRFQIYWAAVQPAPNGGLDWKSTDRTVALAAAHRIDLLPILVGTPGWVAPRCPTCNATIRLRSDAQRAAWKTFLRAAVKRYGPGGSFWRRHPRLPADPITHWQIWNEQNNPLYRDPPQVYARLVAISKRVIDSVDPRGQVVLGGMFGTPKGSRRRGVTAWSYLDLLLKDGADGHFDAVALHPYSPTLSGMAYQIKKVRAVLDAHGLRTVPILITEIGWGSSKKTHPGTGSRGAVFNVGLEAQRRNLENSFSMFTSNRTKWGIGGVYWYTWKDPRNPPPGLCAFCYSSGLYHADGATPKPALSAYESFTADTRPAA